MNFLRMRAISYCLLSKAELEIESIFVPLKLVLSLMHPFNDVALKSTTVNTKKGLLSVSPSVFIEYFHLSSFDLFQR